MLGSHNKINNVHATINALEKAKDIKQLRELRK
jgi:ribosomal protein S5